MHLRFIGGFEKYPSEQIISDRPQLKPFTASAIAYKPSTELYTYKGIRLNATRILICGSKSERYGLFYQLQLGMSELM